MIGWIVGYVANHPELVATLMGGVASLVVGGMKRFGGTRFKWFKMGVKKLNEKMGD